MIKRKRLGVKSAISKVEKRLPIPSIQAVADTTGTEGSPMSLIARATDPDVPPGILTISVAGSPASLSFTHTPTSPPATATLSGTLTHADAAASPHHIVWTVGDANGATATAMTILHVTTVTGVSVPDASSGPPRVVYFGSRPNPFQLSTRIELRTEGRPLARRLALRIYDIRGRLVRTLLEGIPWGPATVSWDGITNSGERAGSGVYYYRLEMGNARLIRSLVLLR